MIVQLGGQTALKLAEKLHKYGIKIIGTSFDALDLAEDRGRFSTLLKDLGIPYPEFGVAQNADEAIEVSKTIGFPLLVRPSYVLGGQSMKIVINEHELEHHIIDIWKHLPGEQSIARSLPRRRDRSGGRCDLRWQNVYIIGIMQHIEPAGIHSGDSYAVLPPYNLGDFVVKQIEHYTTQDRAGIADGKGSDQHSVRDQERQGIHHRSKPARIAARCRLFARHTMNRM